MSTRDDQTPARQSERTASRAIAVDETTNTYRTQFDVHSRPPSEAVIEAVAAAASSEPLDLPPLYSVVDPDALDALFAPTTDSRSRADGAVRFEFADQHVTVYSYGIVEVTAS